MCTCKATRNLLDGDFTQAADKFWIAGHTCWTNLESCALFLLQDNAFNYDKGVLAEILEPIMGKGLIPADLETWKPRRRAIVPAFHKAYLDAMVAMFGRCTHETIRSLDALTEGNPEVHICP